ncbi:MAG: hypothetical protein E7592_05585 [Ruminococcaceae bacterium]|nr:hypothetical protein [Oscillospiraceae bacterium]
MIDLSQQVLLALLIKSFLAGVVLGVFYDLIRAFKMFFGVRYALPIVKRSVAVSVLAYIVTFLTDILFWIVVGITSILLMYGVGGGVFRGLTYLGLAVGALLYYFSIGRLVLKVSETVVTFVKRVVRRVAKILAMPFVWVGRGLIFLFHLTIGKFLGKIKDRRAQKKKCAEIEPDEATAFEDGGKEEFVYVDGKNGYKRDGRISFGYIGKGS